MTLQEQLDNYAITQEVAREARESNDEIKRLERAIADHLKWLDARAKWLRKEYLNGGNYEHLSTREAECMLAAERLKELLPEGHP